MYCWQHVCLCYTSFPYSINLLKETTTKHAQIKVKLKPQIQLAALQKPQTLVVQQSTEIKVFVRMGEILRFFIVTHSLRQFWEFVLVHHQIKSGRHSQ